MSTNPELTPRQRQIIYHALGLDSCGRGRAYRNHFCAGDEDEQVCRELVEAGYMQQHHTTAWMPYFNCSVTDAGIAAIGVKVAR